MRKAYIGRTGTNKTRRFRPKLFSLEEVTEISNLELGGYEEWEYTDTIRDFEYAGSFDRTYEDNLVEMSHLASTLTYEGIYDDRLNFAI